MQHARRRACQLVVHLYGQTHRLTPSTQQPQYGFHYALELGDAGRGSYFSALRCRDATLCCVWDQVHAIELAIYVPDLTIPWLENSVDG